MELIMGIKVMLGEQFKVSGEDMDIVMINFTGTAYGKYFNGEVIGNGVDTQKIQFNKLMLSARYMLEGKDYTDNPCRVFIENNGSDPNKCTPYLVTDSKALNNYLQAAKLTSTVSIIEEGILVSIFKE